MLDTLEIRARTNLRAWGFDLTPTVILRPASPCGRRFCGGSVLSLSGSAVCLLCARPFGRPDYADMERELARESGLAGLAKVVLGDNDTAGTRGWPDEPTLSLAQFQE